MNLIDKIALVGQRMKSEQISLKESLLVSSRVSVSDDSVEGVDRLIYNHCLNKKNLSDFFGKSRVTFNKILADLEDRGLVGAPIFQNKNHLYTRWDVQKIMDALDTDIESFFDISLTESNPLINQLLFKLEKLAPSKQERVTKLLIDFLDEIEK